MILDDIAMIIIFFAVVAFFIYVFYVALVAADSKPVEHLLSKPKNITREDVSDVSKWKYIGDKDAKF